MTSFTELREEKVGQGKHLCVGIDPSLSRQPIGVPTRDFLRKIVDAVVSIAGCIKPNVAFFEAMGDEGLMVYRQLIDYIVSQDPFMPIIGDAKRGDIGATNMAYAKAFYEELNVHSITLNPYLGYEGAADVFQDFPDKTGIFLCRTTNPGARVIQDLPVLVADDPISKGNDYAPLFLVIARMVVRGWSGNGSVGLVAGATYAEDILKIREVASSTFLLIPGVGKQQGDLVRAVKNAAVGGGDFVINVSSGVTFADSSSASGFANAARSAAQDFDQQIRNAVSKAT